MAEREKLEEALEAMMECERWEWKQDRRKEFMEALDAYVDHRVFNLVSGALKSA
jgi:hypothetical protein